MFATGTYMLIAAPVLDIDNKSRKCSNFYTEDVQDLLKMYTTDHITAELDAVICWRMQMINMKLRQYPHDSVQISLKMNNVYEGN